MPATARAGGGERVRDSLGCSGAAAAVPPVVVEYREPLVQHSAVPILFVPEVASRGKVAATLEPMLRLTTFACFRIHHLQLRA